MDYASQCSQKIPQKYPKKGKEQEKKEIPKPSQKYKFCIAGYVDFFIFIHFFKFLIFKSFIMDYASQCSETSIKRGKNKKKRPDQNPLKTSNSAYADMSGFFFFFLFLSNLPWIMHHSVHKYPKKGKRTRKKRNTKTLPKIQILHSRICRFFHFYTFF